MVMDNGQVVVLWRCFAQFGQLLFLVFFFFLVSVYYFLFFLFCLFCLFGCCFLFCWRSFLGTYFLDFPFIVIVLVFCCIFRMSLSFSLSFFNFYFTHVLRFCLLIPTNYVNTLFMIDIYVYVDYLVLSMHSRWWPNEHWRCSSVNRTLTRSQEELYVDRRKPRVTNVLYDCRGIIELVWSWLWFYYMYRQYWLEWRRMKDMQIVAEQGPSFTSSCCLSLWVLLLLNYWSVLSILVLYKCLKIDLPNSGPGCLKNEIII